MIEFFFNKSPRELFFKLNFFFEFISFFKPNSNTRKFINFCKIISNKHNQKSNSQILIELNSHYSSFISLFFFCNFLKKKLHSNLISYDNNILFNNFTFFYQKIKNFFYLPIFKIYQSLGIEQNIIPKINDKIMNEIKKNFDVILGNIKDKKDIETLKVNDVWIGDLVYDSYLKKFKQKTIDLESDKFKSFLKQSLYNFYYWYHYFQSNDVKAVVSSHSVYTTSIILRIAIKYKILVYQINMNAIYKLDSDNLFAYKEFNFFKEEFNSLDNKEQKLNKAKINIERRLSGEVGVDMPYSKKSAYKGFDSNKRVLNDNNKIKILVAAHCFFDSPHPYGLNLFPDFYEWLKYLSIISKKTDYEWYIKMHPDFIPKNFDIIKKFIKNNNKFKLLDSNVSHNQLIYEGINVCLTVYGTIGAEYAYKNTLVINASKNNPHNKYSFNITPKNINEYNDLLINLENVDHQINKDEVLEFYYMHNIYRQKNLFVEDYIELVNKIGGRELADKKINSSFILGYYLNKIYTKELELKILDKLNLFFSKSEYKCGFSFLENFK